MLSGESACRAARIARGIRPLACVSGDARLLLLGFRLAIRSADFLHFETVSNSSTRALADSQCASRASRLLLVRPNVGSCALFPTPHRLPTGSEKEHPSRTAVSRRFRRETRLGRIAFHDAVSHFDARLGGVRRRCLPSYSRTSRVSGTPVASPGENVWETPPERPLGRQDRSGARLVKSAGVSDRECLPSSVATRDPFEPEGASETCEASFSRAAFT